MKIKFMEKKKDKDSIKKKTVCLTRTVLESILVYAKHLHPKEGILLLRGKIRGNTILVGEVVIPPQAVQGVSFSAFPMFMLPVDPTIIGVMHSHPSGVLKPSTEDLNNFYGKIMVIVGYPYTSKNIAIFDCEGKTLKHEVIS